MQYQVQPSKTTINGFSSSTFPNIIAELEILTPFECDTLEDVMVLCAALHDDHEDYIRFLVVDQVNEKVFEFKFFN